MTIHVIGAGLAGLSAALKAVDAGCSVIVHEAAGQAGGRCRSWIDAQIGQRIDNGTHLIAGGNPSVHALLARTGATASLRPIPEPLRLYDLADGESWVLSTGPMLQAAIESVWHFGLGDHGTVAGRAGQSALYGKLWEPLSVAILNTPGDIASARLMRAVIARTIWRGKAKARLFIAAQGLTETFVAPTVATLAARNVLIRYNTPLKALEGRDGHVDALLFDGETVPLSSGDQVILAVPWWSAAKVLPGIPDFPESPIVNAHFRVEAFPATFPDGAALGLTSGIGQWLFRRGNVLSVTISAASAIVDRPADDLSLILWNEAARALGLAGRPAASRIIKERRATLLHTQDVERMRPESRRGDNLWLAGDWTATGLPCTIEGTVQSGRHAADLAVVMAGRR